MQSVTGPHPRAESRLGPDLGPAGSWRKTMQSKTTVGFMAHGSASLSRPLRAPPRRTDRTPRPLRRCPRTAWANGAQTSSNVRSLAIFSRTAWSTKAPTSWPFRAACSSSVFSSSRGRQSFRVIRAPSSRRWMSHSRHRRELTVRWTTRSIRLLWCGAAGRPDDSKVLDSSRHRPQDWPGSDISASPCLAQTSEGQAMARGRTLSCRASTEAIHGDVRGWIPQRSRPSGRSLTNEVMSSEPQSLQRE